MTVCMHLCAQTYLPICVHVEVRGFLYCSLPYWPTDISQWTWSSLFWQAPGNCLPLTFRAGVIDMCDWDYVTVISLYLSAGVTNSGPHTCITTTLLNGPPSQPLNYSYLTRVVRPIQSQIHNLLCFCLLNAGITSMHRSTQLKNNLLLLCISSSVGVHAQWPHVWRSEHSFVESVLSSHLGVDSGH